MSIGTFQLVKNEREWVGPHILQVLPYVDQMVWYDGNSTDGTLEIIKHLQKEHPHGRKIHLFEGKDPADLRDDYVRLFNECMWRLETEGRLEIDWAWFLHPDMFVLNPEDIVKAGKSGAIAQFMHLDSYAGNPGGQLYKFSLGRMSQWKNLYRFKNPYLGAHYWGHYGAANEDVYFSEITGDEHKHFGNAFSLYPYEVADSHIKACHFSDVRTYERRLQRMTTCLINQGHDPVRAVELAREHPRVTIKNDMGHKFEKSDYPEVFKSMSKQFDRFK